MLDPIEEPLDPVAGAVEILGADAPLFYFVDINVAKAFVERFACGLAVVTSVGRGTLGYGPS